MCIPVTSCLYTSNLVCVDAVYCISVTTGGKTVHTAVLMKNKVCKGNFARLSVRVINSSAKY